MRIEEIKFWQWIIIGLLLGAGVGYVRTRYADTLIVETVRGDTIPSQDRFEKLVVKRFEDGQRYMNYIYVYPMQDGQYIVTCKIPREENVVKDTKVTIVPMKFRVPAGRYKPIYDLHNAPHSTLGRGKTLPTRQVDTIIDYLKMIADQENELYKGNNDFMAHNLKFGTALSAHPGYMVAVWGGGTFVIVGIIWPILLQLLMKGGFARPPREKPEKDEYDLSRFGKGKPDPKPQPKSTEITQEDMDRLTQMEKELEKQLAADPRFAQPAAAVAGAKTEAPVRKLTAAPAEEPTVAPDPQAEAKKDFGATHEDFYPTEVHVRKKKE